jgi:serine protease AprX
MRYSITGVSIEQVEQAGVAAAKHLKHTGVMFAELTAEQVSKLKALGCTVEPIQTVDTNVSIPKPVPGSQTYTPQQLVQAAGFNDMRGITNPPLYGQGINIAVVDTGIRESHKQVNNRVIYSKNYTKDPMEDSFDHGTGVASIILAVAPSCSILNMKILDSEGNGTTEEVIEAIEDCIELWQSDPSSAPAIINLSIGAKDPGNLNDPLRIACRAALENRIWVSAAAGNGGPEQMTIFTPAVEKYVFATGSIDADDLEVSDFSSRGPTKEGLSKPDAVFFGENIQMASSLGDDALVGKSGTSFAAPFSTGIAALFLEGCSAYRKLRQVDNGKNIEVQVSAKDLLDSYLGTMCVKPESALPGKDYDYGYGIPVGSLSAQAVTGKSTTSSVNLSNSVSAIMTAGMVSLLAKIMPGMLRG